MKAFIILMFAVMAMGCATTVSGTDCKRNYLASIGLTGDPKFAQCLDDEYKRKDEEKKQAEHQRRLKENPNYERDDAIKAAKEKREQIEFEKQKAKASQLGTPTAMFVKYYGLPTTTELKDGKRVLWYDGVEPFFAIFKNDVLDSLYIDRDTLAARRDASRRNQEEYERQYRHNQEMEQRRREAAASAFYQSRPKTTNCNRIGNQVQCTSY